MQSKLARDRVRLPKQLLPLLTPLLLALALFAVEESQPEPPRRLEVLFLGSRNISTHDPISRFRVIRQALGKEGINFTYTGTLEALTPENLARYDVLLIFANQYTIDKETQGKALLDFARNGGGCVLLHCAAGCFRDSQFDEYVDLLGAQFKSHGDGVFRPKTVNPDHPLMQGYEGFECWDETYVHKRHGKDRTILQMRDDEPWTWVKSYGKGRVFYTASGHDHHCWNQPNYHDLIHRAIRWTAGDDRTGLLDRLELPQLSYRQASVPKDPDNPVGPNNDQQFPLTPAESMKMTQVPPGFELKLFASEPMVINPIALNWDEKGRLWVVEAFDYPHKIDPNKPTDRIKILEDTDRDGRADKVTMFAEGLNLCTSVLPVVGGAVATVGRDMVFLRDRDGDDHAEEREVIFSGIKLDDTHACTSNLRYGLDNWIYATVGYSGIDTTVAGERHEFQQAVFRFRLDGSAFEVIQNTSNNTWGLGFTEEGDVVGSTANGNPSWYVSIPNSAYAAGHRPPAEVPHADKNDRLFPITSDYFQNSPKEVSSSGAGHALYSGSLFPEGWRNQRAFICEPPMHLVAAPTHRNEGDRFVATHFEQNIYASADAWSAPVVAETGPDGAVWIADWYNPVVNHNVYRPQHQERGPGNAFRTPDRDRKHGRIYRILPAGARAARYPTLDSPTACLSALSHPDQFWRLTAQRLLVQGRAFLGNELSPLADSLSNLARKDAAPASLHALRSLAGIVSGDDPRLQDTAMTLSGSAHRGVAAAALSLLTMDSAGRDRAFETLAEQKRHPLVRKEAALALLRCPPDPDLGLHVLAFVRSDEGIRNHLATACRLVLLRHPEGFFRTLLDGGNIPGHPLLKRTFDEALAVLERDKAYLSPGLLALARDADSAVAKRLTTAAGTTAEPPATTALTDHARRGQESYLLCIACHQPNGQGLPGAYPPLAGSQRVAGDEETLIKIVLKGIQGPLEAQGKTYNGLMPGHEAALSDKEIAEVLSYVRNAFGNEAGDISEDTVKRIRSETSDRKEPWKASELSP